MPGDPAAAQSSGKKGVKHGKSKLSDPRCRPCRVDTGEQTERAGRDFFSGIGKGSRGGGPVPFCDGGRQPF